MPRPRNEAWDADMGMVRRGTPPTEPQNPAAREAAGRRAAEARLAELVAFADGKR